MSKKYPLWYSPKILLNNNFEKEEIENIYLPPVRPTKEIAKYQKKSFFSTSFWVLIAAWSIILFTSLFDFVLSEEASFTIVGFIALIIIYRYVRSNNEHERIYKESSLIEKNFIEACRQFENQKKIYSNYQEYLSRLDVIKYDISDDKRKFKYIKEYNLFNKFETITKVDEIVKKGVSEDDFFNVLKEKFSNYIMRDVQFGIYYPDIAYVNEDCQLFIDIEIDEPYDLESGEPIHYVGKDYDRNKFFIDSNWMVLRFSEYQVINYPNECVDLLQSIISNFISGDEIKSNLPVDLRWTKSKSYEYLRSNYRESYLNIDPVNRDMIKIQGKYGFVNIDGKPENLTEQHQYFLRKLSEDNAEPYPYPDIY